MKTITHAMWTRAATLTLFLWALPAPGCDNNSAPGDDPETDCADGEDNDGDGFVDCEDADCLGAAVCHTLCDHDGLCESGETAATCPTDCGQNVCGDGIIDADEQCDLEQLGGMTCADLVQGSSGTLTCNLDCTYNTEQCTICGNGTLEGNEECDLEQLGGMTCADLIQGSSGTLACSVDCTYDTGGCAVCGDGIREADEQCDLTSLGGMTCADLIQGSSGTLACDADCTYNTDQCTVCGDGVRNFGEQCDCGTDPFALPPNCMDVNGGADANCDSNCIKIAYCGDRMVDPNEDCDCGDDPSNLPTGCTDVNGGANGDCAADCTQLVACGTDGAWLQCDPLELNPCCDDDWGASMECVTLSTTTVCLRDCTAHSDCYWNNYCEASIGACYIQLCGGTDPIAPMEQCALPSGNPGICVAAFPREDGQGNPTPGELPQGLCMGEENPGGGLAHGDICAVFTDTLSVDRAEDLCDYGRCLAAQGQTTGTCAQYCSWEDTYDAAFYGGTAPWLPCPAGTYCVGLETIDPASGLTWGDYGLCWETVAAVGSQDGMTSCSLVTGQVLSDPSSVCSDLVDFPDGRCVPLLFDQATGERTNGSLLGVCMGDGSCNPCSAGQQCVDGSCKNVLGVWDLCTPQSGTETCPAQTVCLETDAFAAAPAGDTRCIPYCDIDHPDGVSQHCLNLGAQVTGGVTPTCTSWSQAYGANGQADVRQSRLGVCLLN